jgi:alkaline phosphatase
MTPRKFIHRALVLAAILVVSTLVACGPPAVEKPRGVILMIGDGMGFPQVAFARKMLLAHGERWTFEGYPVSGIVSTWSSSNATTDSGAAATAMAAGVKTTNWQLGMTFEGESVPSLAELALADGRRVGYVTTTTLTHATPAAFYTHVANRYADVDEIASDLIAHKADVALGGGAAELSEGPDLLSEAEGLGWTVWKRGADLSAALPERLLGVFADSHLAFRLDDQRLEDAQRAPSLASLTRVALDMVSRDDEPFFLMIEGGRIDHACHSFDAAGSAHELADFDGAVQVVEEFRRLNPSTLVVLTADHATGGLAISDFVDWDELRRQKASVGWMTDQIRNQGAGLEMLEEMTGYGDITEEELAVIIDEPDNYEAGRHLGRLLSERNGVSWVPRISQDTKGHTGEDVPLYAVGPGSERFQGVLDNTEIAIRLREVSGLAAPVAGSPE